MSEVHTQGYILLLFIQTRISLCIIQALLQYEYRIKAAFNTVPGSRSSTQRYLDIVLIAVINLELHTQKTFTI